LNSEVVKNHQKHPTGYQTIQTYMEREYKNPKKFEDYIYVSQLLQAEGMKTAIEAHRRAKSYCMGSLYWQLNDCWPVSSWSSVDYFGNWKAFHYQAKRSFDEVLISVNEEDGQLKVYLVNDALIDKQSILNVRLITFDGDVLWQNSKSILVEANNSKVYFALDIKELGSFNSTQTVLSFQLLLPDNTEKKVLYYFEKPKEMVLKEPKIVVTKIAETTIEVTTDVLAKNVFLEASGVKFEDNYFDLLPGEKKIIKTDKPFGDIIKKTLFECN
jgi:beta-mannosidase